MRVMAACSLGGAGHLAPLIPFLTAARRRGDEILIVGPPALRDMVDRADMPFRAGGEPDEAEVAPIRERLPLAPRGEASVLGNRELFGRLATTAMLSGMQQACVDWAPDLVLRDPCEYASAVVARDLGIPTVQVAISLAEVEAASLAVAGPALDEHCRGLVDEILASPYLTRFPATLDPSPFATTLRYHDPGDASQDPLPDWWNGSDAPLVYATFGTVLGHMTIAVDVFQTALAALADLPVRALLTVGHRFDRSTVGPVPGNVRVEAWVEQARVFPKAELVVCHGGSGTALGALAAGVPVVAVPIFADQFENAQRVTDAGAGAMVHPADQEMADRRPAVAPPRDIADTIRTVLTATRCQQRARDVSAAIAATPTPDIVLDALHTG